MSSEQIKLDRTALENAIKLIANARCAVAMTGAGFSVASGIPDFRSPGGIWSKHDPEKVASIRALKSDPVTVWKFLLELVRMTQKCEPNPAHFALSELEASGNIKGVITQNIDGLHQRAGSVNVIEFHGNCSHFFCSECFAVYEAKDVFKFDAKKLPIKCAECSGIVRPDLVFYGEQIPPQAYQDAFDLADQADLVLVAGTSGEVVPASLIPPRIKSNGGKIIEINKVPSAYHAMSDVFIEGTVEDVLPVIVQNIIK
ncbi:NAD-dependent deacylase [Maridesulfovibrio ferrireducens]|uniref:SIR2 family NAD-dependent protein deacylase n=1 Tax=Maridesulfovibrio ferrireducens TaxID=246191 RepID=UPI001A316F13|nr:NAD-dependent deacylase [Maridesulfovibrio ferrireducens]MBI9110528.1 NAD-dependent deacylase [Maridesulfovibrio ferrireducens]